MCLPLSCVDDKCGIRFLHTFMKCARVQGLVKLNQLWKRGPFARRSRFPKTLRGKTALNTRHFPRRTKAPDRLFDYLNSASCGRAASSPRIQMHLNQDCVVTATTRVGGSPIVCVACAREAVEMQRHAETHRHAPRNLREGASPKALPEHTQRVSELCRQKKNQPLDLSVFSEFSYERHGTRLGISYKCKDTGESAAVHSFGSQPEPSRPVGATSDVLTEQDAPVSISFFRVCACASVRLLRRVPSRAYP